MAPVRLGFCAAAATTAVVFHPRPKKTKRTEGTMRALRFIPNGRIAQREILRVGMRKKLPTKPLSYVFARFSMSVAEIDGLAAKFGPRIGPHGEMLVREIAETVCTRNFSLLSVHRMATAQVSVLKV